MATSTPATRLLVFLTEDDQVGQRSATEALLEAARECGLAGATVWRAVEGYGASGLVRAARLPDLARGLPLVFEVIDDESRVAAFLPVVSELVPGALVTTEAVLTRS